MEGLLTTLCHSVVSIHLELLTLAKALVFSDGSSIWKRLSLHKRARWSILSSVCCSGLLLLGQVGF